MEFVKPHGGKHTRNVPIFGSNELTNSLSHTALHRSATVLKETTATSGETERKYTPRNNNGRRNNNRSNNVGGGQSSLKLENPMKVQKIPSAPQPRRENNRSSGGNGSRTSDNGPRPVASGGGNDANGAKGPGRGPSKSDENGNDDYVAKKPRKTFDGGRCYHLALLFRSKLSA